MIYTHTHTRDAAPVVRGQSVRVDTCPGSFVRVNSCPGEHLSGGNICPPVCLRLGMVTTCLPRLWACWVWALRAQTHQAQSLGRHVVTIPNLRQTRVDLP